MEKRKFTTFLLCMLVITSGICLLPKHIDVKADTYTPDIENDGCINLTYIWQMVERVANVVYDADWSQENNIPKGRAWATAGERYTIDQILVPQFENFTQDDFEFQKLPIGPIDIEPYNKRLYSNKIILNDFSLTTTNPSRTIPITELFPMGIGVDWGGNDLNDTYIFENANVVEKNLFSNDNLCEPYFSEYLNISVQSLNSYNDIAGSLKYLNENDAVPRNQDGFVFIMNESEDCRDKFDNITSASGCILIYNPSFGFRYTQSEGKHFSILEVNWDDDNLTEVLSNIKNGSVFFADNLLDTDTLVCTNLSNDTCLPDGIRVAVIRRTAPS